MKGVVSPREGNGLVQLVLVLLVVFWGGAQKISVFLLWGVSSQNDKPIYVYIYIYVFALD